MARALFFQHHDDDGPDLVGAWAAARGYAVEIVRRARSPQELAAADAADLLVVLGGRMGAYERADHPWLDNEIAAIRARVDAGKPTLGICLGSQMMAAALGARVYKGGAGQEIGWVELDLIGESVLAPLAGRRVFHWHGDTFDLPAGATPLARSALYPQQAFSFGPRALALQFHIEASGEKVAQWLSQGAPDPQIASTGRTEADVLAENARHAPGMTEAAFAVLDRWRAGFG